MTKPGPIEELSAMDAKRLAFQPTPPTLAERCLGAAVKVLTDAYGSPELRRQAEGLIQRLENLGMPKVTMLVTSGPIDNWQVAVLESRLSTVRYIVSQLESFDDAEKNLAAGI